LHRDLVIIGQPKIGKGAILGDFTKSRNALVFDLEKEL
jgi:predicted GTPase